MVKKFAKILMLNALILLGLSSNCFAQDKKTEVLIIGDEQSIVPYSYVYQTFDERFINLTFIACENKTTGWALAELKMDSTKSYDLIVLFIGLNDVYGNINHHVSIKNYDGLINASIEKSRQVIAITLPYSHNVATSSKTRYLTTYFLNEFIMSSTLVTVIDINEALENFIGSNQLFKDNSLYFNPDGHFFLKELLLNELVNHD